MSCKNGNLHVLSRHETSSNSHKVSNVRAVPVASKAHTGPAGGDAHLPAQRGGGTPSLTRALISSAGALMSAASPMSLASPMRDGRNGTLAGCTSFHAGNIRNFG